MEHLKITYHILQVIQVLEAVIIILILTKQFITYHQTQLIILEQLPAINMG